MILYHGTDSDNVMDILKYGLQGSDEDCTAGASGIYLSSSTSPQYGDGTVLKVHVPDNLKIHPDITGYKDLELMRSKNQYRHNPDWVEEYGGADYGPEEKNPIGAGDVSKKLQSLGYDGHKDHFVDDDTVIYSPKHVTVVGVKHADSNEFKPVNAKLNMDQFNPFKDS